MAKKQKITTRKDQFGKLVRWARKQVHDVERDQLGRLTLTDAERQRLTLAVASFYLDGTNEVLTDAFPTA